MKGLVLAGGAGNRLYPSTIAYSKQLLPVYGKPMVYYPISVLMLSGIRDICVITTPDDKFLFQKLLGDGTRYGIRITYVEQPQPGGIAQAFILAEEFIGEDDVALVLGDNIFYGQSFTDILRKAINTVESENKAVVFSYYVNDPERYGVIEFDSDGLALSIEEKPEIPRSNYAVVGLYFYPNDVITVAKAQRPSKRGELEITDVNEYFLKSSRLRVMPLGRGFAWLDTGTHESLYEAGNFVRTIEKRQGLQIACLEEIAYNKGWISRDQIEYICKKYRGSEYVEMLKTTLNRQKNDEKSR